MIVSLSSCRLVRWGKEHFEQGEVRTIAREPIAKNLKTTRVYNQFSTVGTFDVLFLSDEVRESYGRLYATKHDMQEREAKEFVRRQLAENDQYFSFYILGYIPVGTLGVDDKDHWNAMLMVDGKHLAPQSIKTAELSPEYSELLKKVPMRFRTVQIAKFPKRNASGELTVPPHARELVMVLNTVDRSTSLSWSLKS